VSFFLLLFLSLNFSPYFFSFICWKENWVVTENYYSKKKTVIEELLSEMHTKRGNPPKTYETKPLFSGQNKNRNT
jgi:hypothetical protein